MALVVLLFVVAAIFAGRAIKLIVALVVIGVLLSSLGGFGSHTSPGSRC